MQIGGLPTQSAAYRKLAGAAQRHGLRVLTPHGGGPAGAAADFETPVVRGRSAGTFFSIGDLPYGAVGTVTYTTAQRGAVAFGHPLMWTGSTSAFFTNAWIDGVWSSSLGSYKLGSPSAVRGSTRPGPRLSARGWGEADAHHSDVGGDRHQPRPANGAQRG